MKRTLSKIAHTIASLKVAIILLILIAIYIVIGTLLPQHSPAEWYLEAYPSLGPVILKLSLDSAYASPIFIALVILFAINLGACTLLSLPGQAKQGKAGYFPPFSKDELIIEPVDSTVFDAYCKKKRFKVELSDDLYVKRAGKFRWGVWGAAITHIGIMVLFVGGVIGNLSATEDVISLLPGNEVSFEKEGFSLRLDDFYMTFEDGGAVKQYISEVSILDDDGTETRRTLWVNNPLHHKDLKFYQASFGWTGNLKITDSTTKEVMIDGLLRSGRTYFHQDSHLTIYLYGYYPEMAIDHDQQPLSLSNRETNPYYAVILYEFGKPIGSYMIEPGEVIVHNDLEITFTHSVAYTGLLVRNDPSYPIVLTGFFIILLGMFVSFYCYPRFLQYADGQVKTASRKNGWVFHHATEIGLSQKQNHTGNED